MDFSVPQLFEHLFAAAPEPLSLSQLRLDLNVSTPEQSAALDLALEALQKLEFISLQDQQITYRQNQDLVVGRLRCSSKGFCFAIRDQPGVEDIYIHGSNLHGAWNGDQVLAKVTKDGSRRRSPEGQVAAVIERANPTFVGRIKQAEDGFRILPLDDRLLFELRLASDTSGVSARESTSTGSVGLDQVPASPQPEGSHESNQSHELAGEVAGLEDGRFAYVEVLRYPLADQLPLGRIRKILGSNPETSMDIDLVCCRHDLPQHFRPEALEEADAVTGKISKTEMGRRQDFRDWLTVTLDPSPLDPGRYPGVALSLGSTDDQGWQLGVHIADAAYWIPAAGALEQEILERGTAVYLDTATLPMVPPQIQDIVALRPQKETLTLSVLMELAADGSLVGAEIHPGIINPRAHLSYETVQALLANPSVPINPDDSAGVSSRNLPDLISLLRDLETVAQIVAQQRRIQGGLDLPLPPLHPTHALAETRQGILLLSREQTAQRMMAEFSLLTQRVVATHFQQLGIPALYRVQDPPSLEVMQSFLRLAANLGLVPEATGIEAITPELWQGLVGQIQAPEQAEVCLALTAQMLNCLPPMRHELEPDPAVGHFGLGIPMPYGPVVDPLRDGAALLNQRSLHLLFRKGRDRRSTRVKEGVNLHSSSCHGQITWKVLPPKEQTQWSETLQAIQDPLNQQYQRVMAAEQELAGLKKSQFIQEHLGETLWGLVTGVQNYGFFVSVDPVQAEGLVHVSSLKSDWYEYRGRQQSLVGRKNRRQFRLGDRLQVRIKSVDYYRQQIDLEVISEGTLVEDDSPATHGSTNGSANGSANGSSDSSGDE